MNALNTSHATLIAEVAALRAEVQTLRATLTDSIALCEELRATRDKQTAAIADLRDACETAASLIASIPGRYPDTLAQLRAALERSA